MSISMKVVQQNFSRDGIVDPCATVRVELAKLALDERIHPGMRVAIAVGSRGISRYAEMVGSVIGWLQERGAQPFIIPAMGSHAGGTADSQRRLLEDGGFGERCTGVPILSSMDSVLVGTSALGYPVRIDRHAAGADALIVVNRIKAHTDFNAPLESGLAKMLVVGLGKQQGAEEAHRSFHEHGFYPALLSAAEAILTKVNFLFGLAIVENERHEPLIVEAVRGDDLFERERALLEISKQRMPRIPFRKIDLLIVDRMGKDISGSGMDPNVLGRKNFIHFPDEDEFPKARFIYVRSLTPKSYGNATGLGFAEFVREDFCAGIDYDATYTNCLTSGTPYGAAIPVRMKDDRTVIETANRICGREKFRIVRIRDTLSLETMWASEDALEELEPVSDAVVGKEGFEMEFNSVGNLLEMKYD